MRVLRLGSAGLLALVLLAGCSSSGDGDAAGPATTTTPTKPERSTRTPSVAPATIEGPVTVGQLSPPADPRPVDLGALGYVQEEYFASGTATAYRGDGGLRADGVWKAVPATTAPYKTRFLVRRPADAAKFDGTVVVEWFNVSAVEAAPEWSYTSPALTDTGAAWVGVSVQALGVVGGQALIQTGDPQQAQTSSGIKGSNPERYGSLDHPGDAYSFDIYSQVAAALRSPAGRPVLGGAEPRWIVAAGESQSAGFLATYHNAVQPVADAFDGFFIHSRGAGAARLDGSRAVGPGAQPARLRTDLDVPVLVFETETDVGPLLRFGEVRQPDHRHLRIWEAAGTSHADAHLVGRNFPLCPAGINDGPHHYVATAGMQALLRWIERGTPPPEAEPIEVDGTTVRRDELGLARGGIRTPSVDVPASRLSGESAPGAPLLCSLFGSSTPFDAATLTSLYGSRDAYLETFDAALDAVVKAGFVRRADRDAYAAEARAVTFP